MSTEKNFKWDDNNVREFVEQYFHHVDVPFQGYFFKTMADDFKQSKLQSQDKQVGWEIVAVSNSHGQIAYVNTIPTRGAKIHSVKRLSDGEVFTVGEKVTRNNYDQEIYRFEIDGDNMKVAFHGGDVIGFFNLSDLSKIQPQPSSIDRIETEITVSEMYSTGNRAVYGYSFNVKNVNIDCGKVKKAIEQAINGKEEKTYTQSEVNTIRREEKAKSEKLKVALDILSRIWYYGNFKIETANEKVLAGIMNELGLFPTTEMEILNRPSIQNYFEKYLNYPTTTQPKEEDKPVLFTTEDGVDVCSNDVKCYCVYPNDCKIQMVYASRNELSNMDWKRFNVKENAERWLIENKPCLSLNDLLKVWEGYKAFNDGYYKTSPMYKRFEKLAAQKLKQ